MTPTTRPGLGRSAYRLPLMVIDPEVGGVRPQSARRVVDLPAPFGPRKPVTVPGVRRLLPENGRPYTKDDLGLLSDLPA